MHVCTHTLSHSHTLTHSPTYVCSYSLTHSTRMNLTFPEVLLAKDSCRTYVAYLHAVSYSVVGVPFTYPEHFGYS